MTIGGVGKAGEDILLGQVGEVGENFGMGHARGEIGKDIVNGDAHASNAGFATALAGFEGDDVLVVHGWQSWRDVCILAYRSIHLRPNEWRGLMASIGADCPYPIANATKIPRSLPFLKLPATHRICALDCRSSK